MATATSDKKASVFRRMWRRFKRDNEKGARTSIVEELFYDFNRSRTQVYTMNFVRGLFFGAGSVIGGTVVIALLVWLLSTLGHIIPPLGHFFDNVGHLLESHKR